MNSGNSGNKDNPGITSNQRRDKCM